MEETITGQRYYVYMPLRNQVCNIWINPCAFLLTWLSPFGSLMLHAKTRPELDFNFANNILKVDYKWARSVANPALKLGSTCAKNELKLDKQCARTGLKLGKKWQRIGLELN